MTASPAPADEAAWLLALERAADDGTLPDLDPVAPDTLDRALRSLADRRRAGAVPLLTRLAAEAPAKQHRKAARRALYRLEQAGVAVPPPPPATPRRPVIAREPERATRAWVSGVDGTGSRGVWVLLEGGLGGGLALASMIVSDEAGILDAAGGPTTRKRLETEVAELARAPGLPWVETTPGHVARLVAEALEAHARAGTAPPADVERWRPMLAGQADDAVPAEAEADPALVDRSAELLERPELAGWFVDPGLVHEDAVQLLGARESRLVLSEQVKAEREAAIVDAVIERLFDEPGRQRWAGRLVETGRVLRLAGRPDPVPLMEATAAALRDAGRPARAIPFVRALASRGLELAAEVALGRARLAEVSRAPRSRRPA